MSQRARDAQALKAPVRLTPLDLAGLGKTYAAGRGTEVSAVIDVTMTVGPGEIVALTGPSGSGKTTLLLLAAAMLRPDSGQVRVLGELLDDIGSRQANEYRRRDLGFVPQSYDLVSGMTARDNVAVSLALVGLAWKRAVAAAERSLDEIGLADRLDHTTEDLSGGEQQRVAIARAVAKEPKILLADEPTSNLDKGSREPLLRLFHRLADAGVGVLLVTHDPEVTDAADKVVSMRDGRLLDTREKEL